MFRKVCTTIVAGYAGLAIGCALPCDDEDELETLACQIQLDDSGSLGDAPTNLGSPGNWDLLDWDSLEADDVVGQGSYTAFVLTVVPPTVGYACLDPDEGAVAVVVAATPEYDALGHDGCPAVGTQQWINCSLEFAISGACDVENYITPVAISLAAAETAEPAAETFYSECMLDDGLAYEMWSDDPDDDRCL